LLTRDPDFSINFTVTNATGTGQVAVKVFTPLDEVTGRYACLTIADAQLLHLRH
jgi:hypothetical protein